MKCREAGHVILGVQTFSLDAFTKQIMLNEKNMWATLEYVVKEVSKQEDGNYVMLKDPAAEEAKEKQRRQEAKKAKKDSKEEYSDYSYYSYSDEEEKPKEKEVKEKKDLKEEYSDYSYSDYSYSDKE